MPSASIVIGVPASNAPVILVPPARSAGPPFDLAVTSVTIESMVMRPRRLNLLTVVSARVVTAAPSLAVVAIHSIAPTVATAGVLVPGILAVALEPVWSATALASSPGAGLDWAAGGPDPEL